MLVHSLTHSPIHPPIHSFTHPCIHPSTHPSIHSLTHSLTHSLARWLARLHSHHSLTHLPSYPLTRPNADRRTFRPPQGHDGTHPQRSDFTTGKFHWRWHAVLAGRKVHPGGGWPHSMRRTHRSGMWRGIQRNCDTLGPHAHIRAAILTGGEF